VKRTIISLSLLLILALVACTGTKGTQSNQAETSSPLNQDYENALPVLTQIMIGTFKLEGGELAVDTAQATELLPLWKAFRGLTGSDSASSLELEALADQVQEARAPEQIQAIASMQLTREDMVALAQERGIEMAQGGGRGDFSPEQIATMQAQRSASGGSGRGIPGMGGRPGAPGGVPSVGGAGAGEAPSADQIATLRAERGGSAGVGISPVFFDALIELLEQKVGLAS
jgi:hypothetical protein